MADGDHELRLKRQRQIHAAFASGFEIDSPPPYLLHSVDLIYVVCQFDPGEARAILPAEFELADPVQGIICLLVRTAGSAISPFTGGFATLQVKGHDSVDGWPANFLHAGFYSGLAGTVLHGLYNDRLSDDGSATIEYSGPDFVAIGRTAKGPAIRISGTRTDRVGPTVSGVNHYLGQMNGSATFYSTTYTTQFRDLKNVTIDVLDGAPATLRRLRPTGIVWPLSVDGMTMTFSPPQMLATGEDVMVANATRASLLDALSRVHLPAAIVGDGGTVIGMNREAEALAGDGFAIRANRIVASSPACQGPLERALADALRSRDLSDPISLARSASPSPLIARAMLAGVSAARQPAALVLFVDPTSPGPMNTAGALEVMGLTPAEARLAALVGAGVSPKAAARQLDITEHTARSALKVVYDKLSISRQVELGKLVARLDALGT